MVVKGVNIFLFITYVKKSNIKRVFENTPLLLPEVSHTVRHSCRGKEQCEL